MPRAAHQVLVHVPQPIAWRYLTDVALMPDWAYGVKRVEFTTNQKTGVGTQWRQTDSWGPAAFTHLMEITSAREPEEHVIESVARPHVEFIARLVPEGESATRIAWEVSIEFPYGPMGAMGERAGGTWVVGTFLRRLAEGFKRYVETRERTRGPRPVKPHPGAEEVGGSFSSSRVVAETARLETTGDRLGPLPPVEPPEHSEKGAGGPDEQPSVAP